MDGLAIARLGLGLLGVLAAVQGLTAFPELAGSAAQLSAGLGSLAALFSVFLPFALVWFVSYYLVFRNLSLARLLTVERQEQAVSEPPPFNQVAVGLTGVLIIVYALPNLIASLGVATTLGMNPQLARYLIGYVAQTAVGLILVLWPRHLIALWLRARTVASSGSGDMGAAV